MKVVDLFRDRVQFCVSGSKTEKDGRGCWVVLSVVLDLMCLCVMCLVYCLSEHRSYRWKATANLLVPTMLGRGKNLTSGVRLDGWQLGWETRSYVGWEGVLRNRVFPDFHYFARLDVLPDVLVLHVSSNDLGAQHFCELIRYVKFNLLWLWCMITRWSDIMLKKNMESGKVSGTA